MEMLDIQTEAHCLEDHSVVRYYDRARNGYMLIHRFGKVGKNRMFIPAKHNLTVRRAEKEIRAQTVLWVKEMHGFGNV